MQRYSSAQSSWLSHGKCSESTPTLILQLASVTSPTHMYADNRMPRSNTIDHPRSSGNHPGVYIDAHCHLERETYGDELEAVIARAEAAGLTHFVAVGATRLLEGAREAVVLAAARSNVYATAGIHPH